MNVPDLNETRAKSPSLEQLSPCSKQQSAFSTPSTVSPIPSTCCDPKDDMELMLLHEDFPKLLDAAVDLKEIREHIASHRDKETSETSIGEEPVVVPVFQQIAKSSEHNDQILSALDRMQKAFISHHPDFEKVKIPLGRYPIIDSVLEDAIAKLQQEYESCEAWIQQQFPTTQVGGIAFKKRDRGALAVKYPKAQTDVLMEWMIENKDDPFPSEDDVCLLAERTGLTTSQVVNWTTNVRKRNRKAVLDKKKKPHHFIDFLFLVQERENKKAEARRMMAWQHRKSPEYQRSAALHRSPHPRPPNHYNVHPQHTPRHMSAPSQGNHPASYHRRSKNQLFSPFDQAALNSPHQNDQSPDMAVPDNCISKLIFDEVEDRTASARHYDELMNSVKIEEWADIEGYSPAVNSAERRMHNYDRQDHQAPPQRHILPSVTMDSHDDARNRISSLDIEMEHHGQEIDDFVAKSITTNDDEVL